MRQLLRAKSVRHLAERVGRRGLALVFFSVLDIGISIGIFTIADYAPSVRIGYGGQAAMLPLPVWAWLWLIVGVICCLQAFSKHDRTAFVLGATLKVAWGSGFILGFFLYDIPRAWLSSIIYLTFGGFVLMISGWEENHPTIIMVEDK